MERHLPFPPQLPWMPDPKIFEPMAKLDATASVVAEMTRPLAEAREAMEGPASALAEVTRPMAEAIEGLPTPPQFPQMPDRTIFEPMAELNATANALAGVTRPTAEVAAAMEGHLPTPPQLPHMPDLTTSMLDSLDTVEQSQVVAPPGIAHADEAAVTEVDTFVVDPGEVAAHAIREEHERNRRLEQAQRRRDRWTYGVVAAASAVLGAAATEIAHQIAALLT